MQIAELFVSLGVKNSDKTIGALTQVKTGLSSVASTSLEAKAAIIGAMYALEQLMSQSAARGTELSNFNALTGISIKQLQQWQYAARQAGESNEQFAGTVKGIQEKMADMKLNAGQPDKLPLLASAVGFDVKKAFDEKTGAFYVLKKAQELVDTNVPVDVQNKILKSFNIDEGTIAGLRKHVFTQQNFNKAPIYGDKEVDQLAKVNVLWSNLENKVQMLFGHFTAEHGSKLVGDISKIADAVFKLIGAFSKLSDQLKLFQWVETMFKGWETILTTISQLMSKFNPKDKKDELKANKELENNPLIKFFNNPTSFEEENKKGKENPELYKKQKINDNKVLDNAVKNMDNDPFYKLKGLFNSFIDNLTSKSLYNEKLEKRNVMDDNLPNVQNNVTPKIPVNNQNSTNNQNTNINQNLYFQHEGKEHPAIKDSVHKAVGEAWKQSSAQSQAT